MRNILIALTNVFRRIRHEFSAIRAFLELLHLRIIIMSSSDDEESYLEEAERTAKQKYLREEIIDMEYDPELFTEFFKKMQGEEDIGQCDFQSLEAVVREFKMKFRAGQTLEDVIAEKQKAEEKEKLLYQLPPKRYPPEQSSSDSENHQETPKTPEETEEQPEPLEENPVDQTHFWTDRPEHKPEEVPQEQKFMTHRPTATQEVKSEQDYTPPAIKETVEAKQAPSTEISTAENLKITVSEPKLMQGGFFSSNYILYVVTTEPLGWSVDRRYSEFTWLRECLAQTLPGIYLPPVPPKKNRGRFQEDSIIKRQRFLQRFVEDLLRHPLFRRSTILETFLKESNYQKFQKFKKQSKTRKPEKISEMLSVDGTIKCEYSHDQDKINGMIDYVSQMEVVQKKLKRQASKIKESLAHLSANLAVYGETLNQLENIQGMTPKNEKNAANFYYLNEAMTSWARHETQKINAIHEYFNMYFKYEYNHCRTLKELMKDREYYFEAFKKSETKGDSNLKKNKHLFGYYNYQINAEFNRVVHDRAVISNEHFHSLAKEEAERATSFHMIWSNLMAKLVDARETIINPNKPED